jgi:tripartite-type tricarboxylate transporter receptor subunit TctC
MTPTGTSRVIIARLHAESEKITTHPDHRQRFIAAGVDPITSTPEQFGTYLRSEIEKWGKVVKATGMRVE